MTDQVVQVEHANTPQINQLRGPEHHLKKSGKKPEILM